MTPPLPEDILVGLPLPTRGRWQPLRAGITGLFHYDAQTFTFYRGRLLLRGNNGNGKSMALEVLLPFVLAADTDPGQLSTFGNRNRSMYTWLLGHDSATRHSTARGYVWVEFGRVGPLGLAEYFTAGAGMEATRKSDKLSDLWYFTTAARIGVDLHVGSPGSETPTKEALTGQLQRLAVEGLPGDVHGSKAHKAECNRVLFGLPQSSYQSLLKALRQLRRPKLSDKLSQKALAEILRDALPSLDNSLVTSIASGYERLDRHQASIKELTEVIASLRELDAAYRRYARAHLWQRAHAVINGQAGLERTAKKAADGAATRDRLALEAKDIKTKEAQLNARSNELRGQLAGLQDQPFYKEGRQLEPLRVTAETMEGVARDSRRRAETAAENAGQATQTATETHARSDAQDAETRRHHNLVRDSAEPITLLNHIYTQLNTQLHDHDGTDSEPLQLELRGQLRQAVADLRTRLQTLIGIAARATDASKAVQTSATRVEQARLNVVDADDHAAAASELVRLARDEFLTAARPWMAACDQLTAAGIPWNDVEPARISTAWPIWRDNAHRTRRRQLAALTERLTGTAAVNADSATARAHQDFLRLVDRARETETTADDARRAHAAAQSNWLQKLTDWVAGLAHLPTHGGTLPPADQYDPPRWVAWAAAALKAHQAYLDTAEQDLTRRRQAHARSQYRCDQQHQQLTQERDQEAANTVGAPRVPVTRLESRSGRPGAALYSLIDFDPAVDEARMPALEAALAASGLADAWLHPNGIISAQDGTPLADTQLDPAAKPVERGLGTALRPDVDAAHAAGLSPDVVRTVLASIGLDETARNAPGEFAIGWDGSWRAGPLNGAYRQQKAVLVGAARRERDRQERLAILDQKLTELADQLSVLAQAGRGLTAEAAAIAAAREDARAEADHLPSTTLVEQASKAADDTHRLAREALERLQRRQPEMHIELGRLHQRRTDDLVAVAAAGPIPGIHQLPGLIDPLPPSPTLDQLEAYAQATADTLAAIMTASEAARQGLRAAGERAEQEHEAFPPVIAELLDREREASLTERDQNKARSEFSNRKSEHSANLSTAAEEQQILAGAIAEADLTGWADRLPELPSKVDSWLAYAEDWLSALNARRETTAAVLRTAGAARAAIAHAAAEDRQAADHESRAVAKREQYEKLAARIDSSYTALMAEIAELEEQILETENTLTTTRESHTLAVGEHRAAEVQAATDAAAHRQLLDALPALNDKLWAAITADLPRAAGWDMPALGNDDDPLEKANATAVHVQTLAGSDAARQYGPDRTDDLTNDVYTMRHDADANLSGRLTLIERLAGDIVIVEAVRENVSATLPATIADLNAELTKLQITLNADEAKLLEQFLTDSIRHQVTGHIDAARKQVSTMSQAMQEHRTSAGYRFALEWISTPGADIDDRIVDLLNADFNAAPSAKERLREFFGARIEAIRATRTGQTWAALLEEMLDYRRWYQFELRFAKGADDFAVLDNTHFDKLSGGEKSVALHLPLFAAAATHTVAADVRDTGDPEQPGCPRLILLDEVFAGVDEDMRGELFDLVTSLDMDLVATSEAETGMYAELDGIAIYHLIRSRGVPGVLAARSIWTGSDDITLLDNDMEHGL